MPSTAFHFGWCIARLYSYTRANTTLIAFMLLVMALSPSLFIAVNSKKNHFNSRTSIATRLPDIGPSQGPTISNAPTILGHGTYINEQRISLESLYRSTGEEKRWGDTWLVGDDVCSWDHLTCEENTQIVTQINAPLINSLKGKLVCKIIF